MILESVEHLPEVGRATDERSVAAKLMTNGRSYRGIRGWDTQLVLGVHVKVDVPAAGGRPSQPAEPDRRLLNASSSLLRSRTAKPNALNRRCATQRLSPRDRGWTPSTFSGPGDDDLAIAEAITWQVRHVRRRRIRIGRSTTAAARAGVTGLRASAAPAIEAAAPATAPNHLLADEADGVRPGATRIEQSGAAVRVAAGTSSRLTSAFRRQRRAIQSRRTPWCHHPRPRPRLRNSHRRRHPRLPALCCRGGRRMRRRLRRGRWRNRRFHHR